MTMKNLIKQIIAVMVLISVAAFAEAQSGRNPQQSKLPSNRPIPDKSIMQRKIELMRAKAPKSPGQGQTLIQANPAELRRPAQKPAIN